MNNSHLPGHLDYLDDDSNPTYKPIDALLERYDTEQFEYAQFKYQNVRYLIQNDGLEEAPYCLYFQPRKNPNGILIRAFPTFLYLLDTPILHDGSTVREAFSILTGLDVHIN